MPLSPSEFTLTLLNNDIISGFITPAINIIPSDIADNKLYIANPIIIDLIIFELLLLCPIISPKIEILKQQMNISKYVIFGIPSTYFNMNEKMLGNERGLTLKEWKSLVDEAGGKLVEQTSFHYYKLYRRIFEVKKWLKPKAFWLFVIEKK